MGGDEEKGEKGDRVKGECMGKSEREGRKDCAELLGERGGGGREGRREIEERGRVRELPCCPLSCFPLSLPLSCLRKLVIRFFVSFCRFLSFFRAKISYALACLDLCFPMICHVERKVEKKSRAARRHQVIERLGTDVKRKCNENSASGARTRGERG